MKTRNSEKKIDLANIRKQIRNLNQELTNLIGHKSVYGEITIDEVRLIRDGWIEFWFSKKLTEEEKVSVLRILEKYFGKILDRPQIIKHFKTEKNRWNEYSFFSYTTIKDKPPWDVRRKKFEE